eukprot:gene2062-2250_t
MKSLLSRTIVHHHHPSPSYWTKRSLAAASYKYPIPKLRPPSEDPPLLSFPPIFEEDGQLIIQQAQDILNQQLEVISILKPDDYIRRQATIFASNIGGHFRHILDHYQAIITAAHDTIPKNKDEFPLADYDNRDRDTIIEKDKEIAKDYILKIRDEIGKLDVNKIIEIEFIGEIENFDAYRIPSTVGRELAFASHHGLHHLSTVRLLLKAHLYPEPQNLGIAPSTIKAYHTLGDLRNVGH